MKKIETIIRPDRLADLKSALNAVGITGMSFTTIHGTGREPGYVEITRGHENPVDVLPRIKVETIVEDHMVDDCVQLITEACRSGQIGDGIITISPIERFIRIRTGDENSDAM